MDWQIITAIVTVGFTIIGTLGGLFLVLFKMLKDDIKGVRLELKEEIKGGRIEIKEEIKEVKSELGSRIEKLSVKIEEMSKELNEVKREDKDMVERIKVFEEENKVNVSKIYETVIKYFSGTNERFLGCQYAIDYKGIVIINLLKEIGLRLNPKIEILDFLSEKTKEELKKLEEHKE